MAATTIGLAAAELALGPVNLGLAEIGCAIPHGDILGFAPPLCLSREEADVIVSATEGAIDEAAKDTRAETG